LQDQFAMSRADRNQDTGPPWTASRCNRLLRQLTAFLAKAEKWHRDLNKGPNETKGSEEASTGQPRIGGCADEAKISDPDWLCKNRQSKKRTEKSYLGKRRLRRGLGPLQQVKCLPYTPKVPKATEVIIDTPMMTSILTPPHIHSSELSNDVQIPDSPLQPPPKPKVASLCLKRRREAAGMENALTSSTWSCLIVDQMKQIVVSFLAATSESSLTCAWSTDNFYLRKGSPSLFLSCLYKIPSLIITEQSHHDMNSNGYDGEVQVASTLLADLEDCYGDSNEGWGPLRVVVRAHGIALICNAIRKRFLPVEAAMNLASSVVNFFGVTDATKAIAEAIIEVRQIASPDDLSDVLTRCIDGTGLVRYTDSLLPAATRRAAALKFHLIDLAFRRASPPVPLDFICMRPTFLKDAIRSCSQGQSPDAFSLVKTLLLRFLDLKPRIGEESTTRLRSTSDLPNGVDQIQPTSVDDALLSEEVQNGLAAINSNVIGGTFRSGLVALVAFPISRKTRQKQSNREHPQNDLAQRASICILWDICMAIRVNLETRGVVHLTEDQLQRRAWVIFAYSLVAAILTVPNVNHLITESLEPLMLSCQSRKGLVADLSSLVLDIVTACNLTYEKGQRVHSLHVLREITNTLISHTFWDSLRVTLLFSNVAIEASMAYAQIHANDKADSLRWVTELQNQVQTSLGADEVTMPTPSLNSFGGRFRWDDCISEWVAKTPALVVMDSKGTGHETVSLHGKALTSDLLDNLVSETPSRKQSSPPTRRASTPDSPVDERILRRMKKRKSALEQKELHWDGDFAFRRPTKRHKSFGGELTVANLLTKPVIDLESEDELCGKC
jgi:hypothetical protein